MNAKKIWILAIVFGLIASILFFLLTMGNDEKEEVNEPALTEEELEEEREEEVLDLLEIEQGKRAITIPVNNIQSVTGFIQPGSHVDIISILDDGTAQIILQNIKVLAVGRTTENNFNAEETEQTEYDKVTLELDPNDGPKLSLATNIGQVTLMLRDEEDSERIKVRAFSIEELIKGQTPK